MIFNALMATLDPGDEVIIPAPYWVSYPDITLMADGTPVPSPARETGFKLQPAGPRSGDHAQDQMADPEFARAIPTGAAYTRAELKALTDVLLRHPACLGDDRRHVRASGL